MTVVVTHTTPSDNTFSAAGAAAWDANHAITGLATVASTGAYSDLTGKPTLGTMSSQDSSNVTITGGTIGGQPVADVGSASTLAKLCLMGS